MIHIRQHILDIQDWMIQVRRDIHRYPEIAYEERKTSAFVKETLEDLGFEVRNKVGKTGVIGLWRSDNPGPCLGIRADMDALKVEEAIECDWKSLINGQMHACGHDMHTAMLLGAARILVEDGGLKKSLAGSVKLIFQPAEEGGGGAGAMIADGAMTDPPMDAIFAAHVLPVLKVGQVGYTRGAAMASMDKFFINVKGRGGHAAHPNLAADPIGPAAELVGRIKKIDEEMKKSLIAVCTIAAGSQTNIIPDQARLSGTIRSLDPDERVKTAEKLKEAARDLEAETGLRISVRIEEGYPILINDDDMTAFFTNVIGKNMPLSDLIEQGPTFGSEDMSFFLQKIPGMHYWLGCARASMERPAMLHSPEFDPDEEVMPLGVEIMIRLVEEFLNGGKAL